MNVQQLRDELGKYPADMKVVIRVMDDRKDHFVYQPKSDTISSVKEVKATPAFGVEIRANY